MFVSSGEDSCHNIRAAEYVEYARTCSPLHNPNEPLEPHLNLSRDVVMIEYSNNPYIRVEQWFDQHPGGTERGTREAALNGRNGLFKNLRCDQYRGVKSADGTKRRVVTFTIEVGPTVKVGTEKKPLSIVFKNYNVAVPFAAAFLKVNNVWNGCAEDDAPLLSFYIQTPGGYLQLWDRDCPISLGLRDMDVIYGDTGETWDDQLECVKVVE
jgi:hypothetical protein